MKLSPVWAYCSFKFIGKNVNVFEWAETGSLQLLTTGYNNSVVSCDEISIDHSSVFFSSLSTGLVVAHLEC